MAEQGDDIARIERASIRLRKALKAGEASADFIRNKEGELEAVIYYGDDIKNIRRNAPGVSSGVREFEVYRNGVPEKVQEPMVKIGRDNPDFQKFKAIVDAIENNSVQQEAQIPRLNGVLLSGISPEGKPLADSYNPGAGGIAAKTQVSL